MTQKLKMNLQKFGSNILELFNQNEVLNYLIRKLRLVALSLINKSLNLA